ncbi:hypothetical protein EDD85DRAFT_798616 [Armillaria nabsnona]|nr:hypothetical protein EDD85DRAFT_798616 [Armillaria nabsnona]
MPSNRQPKYQKNAQNPDNKNWKGGRRKRGRKGRKYPKKPVYQARTNSEDEQYQYDYCGYYGGDYDLNQLELVSLALTFAIILLLLLFTLPALHTLDHQQRNAARRRRNLPPQHYVPNHVIRPEPSVTIHDGVNSNPDPNSA